MAAVSGTGDRSSRNSLSSTSCVQSWAPSAEPTPSAPASASVPCCIRSFGRSDRDARSGVTECSDRSRSSTHWASSEGPSLRRNLNTASSSREFSSAGGVRLHSQPEEAAIGCARPVTRAHPCRASHPQTGGQTRAPPPCPAPAGATPLLQAEEMASESGRREGCGSERKQASEGRTDRPLGWVGEGATGQHRHRRLVDGKGAAAGVHKLQCCCCC